MVLFIQFSIYFFQQWQMLRVQGVLFQLLILSEQWLKTQRNYVYDYMKLRNFPNPHIGEAETYKWLPIFLINYLKGLKGTYYAHLQVCIF